jgi:hypothetical protein
MIRFVVGSTSGYVVKTSADCPQHVSQTRLKRSPSKGSKWRTNPESRTIVRAFRQSRRPSTWCPAGLERRMITMQQGAPRSPCTRMAQTQLCPIGSLSRECGIAHCREWRPVNRCQRATGTSDPCFAACATGVAERYFGVKHREAGENAIRQTAARAPPDRLRIGGE